MELKSLIDRWVAGQSFVKPLPAEYIKVLQAAVTELVADSIAAGTPTAVAVSNCHDLRSFKLTPCLPKQKHQTNPALSVKPTHLTPSLTDSARKPPHI